MQPPNPCSKPQKIPSHVVSMTLPFYYVCDYYSSTYKITQEPWLLSMNPKSCAPIFFIFLPPENHTYISNWWFGTCFFFHILGIIIPTDFHIFRRGWITGTVANRRTTSSSMTKTDEEKRPEKMSHGEGDGFEHGLSAKNMLNIFLESW